ncbi:MAG: molybdopterin-dependent oxidoreductase [Deltaproteobacteria bacterium]|nr:molybdopterin-dependent oxidoreductase [Deltaproteobacteria bacterium]
MREEKVTFCRVCEALCGLVATVEDGRVTGLRPDPDHIVSKGYACAKGLAFHDVTHDPDRVVHPMKRQGERWQRIDWDSALGEIGARLRTVRERDGVDAVAFYTGNPTVFSYSARLFAGALASAAGTRNTYSAGTQDNAADFLASKFLYGAYLLQPIPDLDRTDHLLLVGVNPVVSHGTLLHAADIGRRIKAIRERGGKVVLLDPRRTQTAKIASEHHYVRPDSDIFVLMAMLRVILDERLEDKAFLDAHTQGQDDLRRVVTAFSPELAQARSGIDADIVRRMAREFAVAPRACVYERAVCGTFGTLTAWACDVLNIVTGNLDAAGGAIFAGGLLDMVAVTEKIGMNEYGGRHSRVDAMPACRGDLPSGVLVDEILTPGAGQIRALVVTAGNPVLSIPRGNELALAMRSLECSVAIDFYMNETAACADYFLPATTFLEREDLPVAHQNLMLEPFVQWTEPVIAPLGQARQEWEILSELGEAMGLPFLNNPLLDAVRRVSRLVGRPLSATGVIDLMIRTGRLGDKLLPWRSGLSLAEIRKHPHGMRLPGNTTGDLAGKIRHPGGKVQLWNEHLERDLERLHATIVVSPARSDGAPHRRPLQLIGRRDPRSHNSWMHNVPRLLASNVCDLRIHPDDAGARGIGAGQRVRVSSNVGSIEAIVVLSDELMPGVVCMPHGWGHDAAGGRAVASKPGVNCNLLIDRHAMEPLSGMSFLNGFPVEVEKLG